MGVFLDYSHYYDLLYADKNYAAEARFVLERLVTSGHRPATLLDLGCGTGRHALEMARLGVKTIGVDLSPTMLEMGKEAFAALSPKEKSIAPEILQGDIRSVRLNRRFDATVSLFHVMSYQTTEEDLLAALETAKTHLEPGGTFFFDFWHGPGVLAMRPEERKKELFGDGVSVLRRAKPVLLLGDNVVEVHYDILLANTHTNEERHIQETHRMRYWFLPELRFLAKSVGFTLVGEGGWMHTSPPTDTDWAAWMAVSI